MSTLLYIGNPSIPSQKLQDLLTSLGTSHASVRLEQLDRLASIELKKEWVNVIRSGDLAPFYSHDTPVLGKLAKSLKPNGTLELLEPVFPEMGIKKKYPSLEKIRTLRELESDLKVNGFVHVDVTSQKYTAEQLEILKTLFDENTPVDSLSDFSKEIQLAKVTARTPGYTVGASAKLSFGKKKSTTSHPATTKKTWTISADDEDDLSIDRINEDSLLEASDLVKPSVPTASDCSTRKKACKNCTCGRAEEEEAASTIVTFDSDTLAADDPNLTIVQPKKAVKSSCGSCYLGDAFRCASCPYLGMPAFKPGEKVVLGGSMLKDDF